MARGYHDPAVHIVKVSREVHFLRAALPDKVTINPCFSQPADQRLGELRARQPYVVTDNNIAWL